MFIIVIGTKVAITELGTTQHLFSMMCLQKGCEIWPLVS